MARPAALITVTGTAAFVLAACGVGKKQATSGQISVRVGSLIVAVPRDFHRTELRSREHLPGTTITDDRLGVLVTDYRVAPGSPTLTEGVFPASGVALLIGREALGALPRVHLPVPRLPVTLVDLGGPRQHPNGTVWGGVFGFHGWIYTIFCWVGRTAPPHDRAVLEKSLGSIRDAR